MKKVGILAVSTILLLVLAGALFFLTCNQQEKIKEEILAISTEPVKVEPQTVADVPKEIAVKFEDNSPSVTMRQTINGLKDSKVYVFQAKQGKKLYITIRAEKTPTNIRIKQIISPSGKSDGPFGIDAKYPITETGQWKVIVDESNMVGDEYIGDFMLGIALRDE